MADEALRAALAFISQNGNQLPSEMYYLLGLCEFRSNQQPQELVPLLARIHAAKKAGVLSDDEFLAVCFQVKQGNPRNAELALDVYRGEAQRRGIPLNLPVQLPNDEDLARRLQEEANQLLCQKCDRPILGDIASVSGCGHIFHSLCLSDSLSAKIRDGVCPPTCPVLTCRLEVSLADCRMLPRGFRERAEATNQIYGHHIARPQATIICPTVSCQNRGEPSGNPNLHCSQCRTQYCLRCRSLAHPTFQCEDMKPYLSSSDLDSMFRHVKRGVVLKACQHCQVWNPKPPDKLRVQCLCGHTYCVVCGRWDPCACRSL